ncbi:hypothetical protein [Marinicrinis sediminis]|uniref:Acyl carrier protein n=1 Tax=Marinicrinis sediminis TaxID=1652465 RepID=A0ABW5R6V8_9BACL
MELNTQIRELVMQANLFETMEGELDDEELLHLDSMSLIWLITSLEEQFQIPIDYRTEDLSHFQSIQRIEQYVQDKLAKLSV